MRQWNSKKTGILLLSVLLAALLLTGCYEVHSADSYTFGIENGDLIRVDLDTSTGFKMVRDGSNFYVIRQEKTEDGILEAEMLRGGFILTDGNRWQSVYINIDSIPDAWIVEEEVLDGDEYIYVDYSETMYLCEIKLADCQTGVEVSAEDLPTLKQLMQLLTFTAE